MSTRMKRVGNSLLFPQNWPSSISQYPSTVRETASQFWHNLTVYSCSTRSILQCSSKRQQQKCIDVEVTQRNGILHIVLPEKPYEPWLDYSSIKKSFSHYMDYMSLQVSGENKDTWLFETCAGPIQVTKFSKSNKF